MRERGERASFQSGRGFGVEDRFNLAESKPVRQIWNPRGARYAGEALRLGQAERQGIIKVVPVDERRIVKSFMIKNFPPNCSDKKLIAAFQEVGPVVDLFCPRKLDAQGKKFGFVRMVLDKEDEEEETLEKLNSVWMGSYKIRAIVPRFERKVSGKPKEIKKPRATPLRGDPINKLPSKSVREDGRSFASVVQGCKCVCKANQQIEQKITFIPAEEESEWLEKARVGCLKEGFQWEVHAVEIQEEIQWQYEIKSLGEDLILIRDREEPAPAKERLIEWEKHWFKWIRRWKPEDVSRRRAVWTRWYGVPLHTWSERFFRQICLRFGAFLDWDINTKEKLKLDSARIKVRGDSSKFINESFIVTVDRKDFTIRVVEELESEAASDGSFSDSSSADSDTLPGDASCNDKDLDLGGLSGDEIPEAMMGTDGLEVDCEGGGVFPREKGSDNGEAGFIFEAEGKSAHWKSDILGGASDYIPEEGEIRHFGEKSRLGLGLEPNKKETELAFVKGAKIQENSTHLSVEDSLPYPPGWGPKRTEMGASFQDGVQAQEISSDSLPFPPGWGPSANFANIIKGKCEKAEHTEEITKEDQSDSVNERQCLNVILPPQNQEGSEGLLPALVGENRTEAEAASQTYVVPERDDLKSKNKKKGRKEPRAKEFLKSIKRVEKRRERQHLSISLKDRLNCRRSKKASHMGKMAQSRKEAEEVVILGHQLGLQPTAPNNFLVGKIEELIVSKRKEEEAGRGGGSLIN